MTYLAEALAKAGAPTDRVTGEGFAWYEYLIFYRKVLSLYGIGEGADPPTDGR